MLFRRRKPLEARERVLGFIWPRTGFRRAFSYLKQRLIRMPGSDYSLAIGFTCGLVISFTPFVGFHFVLAGMLAWLFRGNILVSALGTLFGNPWTFPFYWLASLRTGNWLLHQLGLSGLSQSLRMQDIWLHPLSLMIPWIVGSLVLIIVTGPLVFAISYGALSSWRRHRRLRRLERSRRFSGAKNKGQDSTTHPAKETEL